LNRPDAGLDINEDAVSSRRFVDMREVRPGDREAWLRLRQKLWPDVAPDQLAREVETIIADRERNLVLVASAERGEIVAFVEAALRDHAEGCASSPVGYIEAWYVAERQLSTRRFQRADAAAKRTTTPRM
jgi:aminoglycoside 6'-N-acetyltransferase I